MKDLTKLSKTFNCTCGTQNKFEFETDLDLHGISLTAKCQSCGRDVQLGMDGLFRPANGATAIEATPLMPQMPEAGFASDINLNEIIESQPQEQAEPVAGQQVQETPVEEEKDILSDLEDEEEIEHTEIEDFSNLFGKM